MLFNSYIFIFVFLPVTLVGFYLIGKRGKFRVAISWLIGASLLFYGWWNPAYVSLIIISILFNYAVGVSIIDMKKWRKATFILGIVGNICLLGYYQYANFFVDNFNEITSNNIVLETIILPLAISFFTFQQITYLVDIYQGKTKEYNFLHYCLFITFFPQLIAGPIVHHRQMLPQFSKRITYNVNYNNIAIGLTIFIIGLFKKVVLADGVGLNATLVFSAVESGVVLSFAESWYAAFAYSFQLYFDFSGYSDMAIGLARMFGILLPVNFYSPYKANNIADFWRRWHITLSNIIKDYMFYPINLIMTRIAIVRHYRYLATFLVSIVFPMISVWLIVGLWHGAGWNFVLFGLIHGVYLIVYQLWKDYRKRHGFMLKRMKVVGVVVSRIITFIAVVFSFVMFRSDSFDVAISIYQSMVGLNGISLPIFMADKLNYITDFVGPIVVSYNGMFYNGIVPEPFYALLLLLFMLIIVWFTPNVVELFKKYNPALGISTLSKDTSSLNQLYWKPTIYYAVISAIGLAVLITLIQGESEFLYFQF